MTSKAASETIAVAADHAGYPLKNKLAGQLSASGVNVLDLGTNNSDSVDYPKFGDAMADMMMGPFHLDLGFTKTEIANYSKGVGQIRFKNRKRCTRPSGKNVRW